MKKTARHTSKGRTIAEVITGFGEWQHPIKIVGALCADGQRRTVRLKTAAATYFSWDGSTTIKGKTVQGFTTVIEQDGTEPEGAPRDYKFTAYPPKNSPLEPGCYYDSARGYAEIGQLVQALAKEKGMKGRTVKPSNEWFNEAVTDAENYLADLAPAKHWAGFYEGSYGVWPIRYKENQIRYIINLDERGEFSSDFYKVDPETGTDEETPFFSLNTEDADELASDGANVRNAQELVDFLATYSGAFQLAADSYTVLEHDDEPQEDND